MNTFKFIECLLWLIASAMLFTANVVSFWGMCKRN